MTRLTRILFAGTLIPAMALIPFAEAFAQVPDQQGLHGPGASRGVPSGDHPAGGMRPGGPPPAGGAMHGEMQHQGAPRAAERAAPAGGVAPAGGMQQRRNAEAPVHAPQEHHAQERPAQEQRAPGERAPSGPAAAQRDTAAPIRKAADPRMRPGDATPNRREATDPTRAGHDAPRDDHAGTPPVKRDAAMPAPGMRSGTPPAEAAQGQRPGAPERETNDQRGAPPAGHAMDRGMNRNSGNGRRDVGQAPGQTPPNGQPMPPNGARVGNRNDHGISPLGAAAIGAAAGFAGGFIAATGAQRLDEIRHDRREVVEDGRTYIREPGRTIVEDGDRAYIVHDENDRFRDLGYDVHRRQDGRDFVDTIDRPDGVQILTFTDPDGRMLRRVRRDRDGREYVLIDNGIDGRIRPYQDDVVDLPPPPLRIPRDRYAVDYADADEGLIYDTLVAPPLAPPPRRYTLDQIRYSPDVRRYVRSVDIDTINFDSGSWIVPGAATGKLQALASAVKRAVQRNPNSVFLVEGFTDATGNPTDNLSLSDRRAQSVATILTKDFNVPPENLTTQGYGQQNPKVDTQGPSAENRRVVVQNITQLLAAGNNAPPQE